MSKFNPWPTGYNQGMSHDKWGLIFTHSFLGGWMGIWIKEKWGWIKVERMRPGYVLPMYHFRQTLPPHFPWSLYSCWKSDFRLPRMNDGWTHDEWGWMDKVQILSIPSSHGLYFHLLQVQFIWTLVVLDQLFTVVVLMNLTNEWTALNHVNLVLL